MQFRLLRGLATTAGVAALMCGCGGPPLTTADSLAAAPNVSSVVEHPPKAWIRPGASNGELLYAGVRLESGSGEGTVILTYPQGELVGSIDIGPSAMCSDTQGDVYLLTLNSAIEFAHGGTQPIRTVRVPGAQTVACAVDPTTGDLAVTFYCPPCGYENLAIFPSGSSQSTRYDTLAFSTATYDNSGNLFLANYYGIAELPSGSSEFIPISLNESVGDFGQIQWDGTYITLENVKPPATISRLSITGSTATVVGQTKFKPYMRQVGYSWIAGDGTVAFPYSAKDEGTPDLGVWKYPKGIHPMHTIKKIGNGDKGFGAITVSVPPTGLRPRR
jgi:hypothetical protein